MIFFCGSDMAPSYEMSSAFGSVSLRDTGDDQDSLVGDCSYRPVYTYYGTLGQKH